MNTNPDSKQTLILAIRMGLIFLLIVWCYQIIRPFIIPLMWGAIIAVAMYPLYRRLTDLSGQRLTLVAVFLAIVLTSLVILPMVLLTSSSIDMVRFIADYLESGKIQLPAIKPMLAQIPFVGEYLQEMIATRDIEAVLQKLTPLLQTGGRQLLSLSASLGAMLLQTMVAIMIAAFFLHQADTLKQWSKRLSAKIAGENGEGLLDLAVATTGNVANGILGVAIIQSIISGLGMMLAGVPGTGFWTMMVLIIATIQLPPMLVLLPISIYLFYTASLTVAIGFLALAIVISLIDTPMRAILMGRDSKTPILIIMMGALGGMITLGIIGLFVGAVALAVGFELLKSWLDEQPQSQQ